MGEPTNETNEKIKVAARLRVEGKGTDGPTKETRDANARARDSRALGFGRGRRRIGAHGVDGPPASDQEQQDSRDGDGLLEHEQSSEGRARATPDGKRGDERAERGTPVRSLVSTLELVLQHGAQPGESGPETVVDGVNGDSQRRRDASRRQSLLVAQQHHLAPGVRQREHRAHEAPARCLALADRRR